jgi:hypothetical protein
MIDQAHFSPLRELVIETEAVKIPMPIEIKPNHLNIPPMYSTATLSKVMKFQYWGCRKGKVSAYIP